MFRILATHAIAFALGICLIIYIPDFFSETWGWVAFIAGWWLAIGAVLALMEGLSHREVHNKMARAFPGYTGERVPVCAFLSYSGPQGEIEGNSNKDYALGISPTSLFLIHISDYSGPEEGGTLLNGLKGGPLRMRREEIVDVSVVEFSDKTIAENARDKRDATERVAETMALTLFGGSLGKIVPFAAVVAVSTNGRDGEACFLFGIPTEIGYRVLALLDQVDDSDIALGAPVGEAAKTIAAAGAQEAADGVMGEGVGEVGGDVLAILAAPGRPAGSTKGETARRAARKIAERIRMLAAPNLAS